MEIDDFIKLHKRFLAHLEGTQMLDDASYELYIDTVQSDAMCHNWVLTQDLESARFPYKDYCCVTLAHHVFSSLDTKGDIDYSNKDAIIWRTSSNTYGIPIPDGGPAMVKIAYCPWCGEQL